MKKRKRLFQQLYPSYLLISLVVLGAVYWFASGALQHFFLKRVNIDLVTQARLLIPQVNRFILKADENAVDELCKGLGRNISTRITVIAADGRVIGDSDQSPQVMEPHDDRPEVIQAAAGGVGGAIRYSRTLQKKMMYVALPLNHSGRRQGVVRTSLPLTDIDDELKTIRIRLGMGGLIIAVIASIICYFISRRISRPVEDLRRGAASFADGNLAHRLLPPNTVELAGLAEAMNDMARQLESRIETIVQQRNEYEAVLSSMTEGVIAVDMQEHVLSINQAGAGILERAPADVKGRSIQEVIRNRGLQQFVARTLEDPSQHGEDVDVRLKKRVLSVHAAPLSDARENRIGTLLVLNDVTRLRHLERMRSDFVANVSHEIKTPLTAIKGFVETLSGGAVENRDEAGKFLGIIEKHVDRLAAIVTDLLQLSRIEAEKAAQAIQFEEYALPALVKTAIQVCRARAEARGIQVRLAGKTDIRVAVDVRLIEQAVVNLLDNAIKYSPDGGAVHINISRQRGQAVVAVEDQGIGIEKKHLPRLFERFYRVDKARSRKLGGTGLGLAIVKHIMQAHNGSVTVTSTPGRGSVFALHLPAK